MAKALLRIQPKYRPVSGEIQGYRIQAAVPNLAARKMLKTSKGFRATSQEVPAFRKPYLIDESMDYANPADISEADMERFKRGLRFAGYSEFELLAAPEKKVSDEVQAVIDQVMARVGMTRG